MSLRPPRGGFSVSRRLSERARAAREDAARAAERQAAPAAEGDPRGISEGLTGGITGMVEAMRDLVERLAATAREGVAQAGAAAPDPRESDQPDQERPDRERPGQDGGSGRETTLGGGRMVFGYTLRMGRDGISAEPFGDVPERAAAGRRHPQPDTAMPAARRPIAEVFEDGDAVVVVAELPGAEADGIVCRADGKTLLIEAAGPRRYRKELALPVPVRTEISARSFRNGILEVRLARADTP